MTNDQRDKSLLLEILHASRGLPRTAQWLGTEMRLAGRGVPDIHGLLREMERKGLVFSDEDGLGILRYFLTPEGRDQLEGMP